MVSQSITSAIATVIATQTIVMDAARTAVVS